MSAETTDPASGGDSRVKDDTSSGSDSQEFSSALVEIEPGVALLLATENIPGLEVEPFTLLDRAHRKMLDKSVADLLAGAAGAGNLIAQGVNGVAQAQGLVRFAPETWKALEQGRVIAKDGYNLGAILGKNGKFAAQIRWVPAGGAQAASVAASLGPALALIAIQAQLGRIESLARQNIALTASVRASLKNDQWAGVEGRHMALLAELNNARAVGAVTNSIWSPIQGLGHETEKDVRLFRAEVHQHLSDLRAVKSNKERRDFVATHGTQTLQDVQSLVLAMTNRALWLALRSAHQMVAVKDDEREQALLDRLLSDSRAMLVADNDEIKELLQVLQREFITAEWQASASKNPFGRGKAVRELAPAARTLSEIVSALGGRAAPRAPIESPELSVPSIYDLTPLREVLTWDLADDEQVLAMALVHRREDVMGKRQLVVTSQRVLLIDDAKMREGKPTETAFRLDEIRHVRVHEAEGKPVRVDIATPAWDHQITFDTPTKAGEERQVALQIGQLLASYMHVPATEVPTRVGLPGLKELA